MLTAKIDPITADALPPDWHASHDNLCLLCRYLVEMADFSSRELLGVIEKPWNWKHEFVEARNAQRV